MESTSRASASSRTDVIEMSGFWKDIGTMAGLALQDPSALTVELVNKVLDGELISIPITLSNGLSAAIEPYGLTRGRKQKDGKVSFSCRGDIKINVGKGGFLRSAVVFHSVLGYLEVPAVVTRREKWKQYVFSS